MTAPAPLDLTALLADLERAHAAATPDEWRYDPREPRTVRDSHPRLPAALITFRDPGADAALIVAAVNAVPTLIAELRKRDAAPSPAAEPPHDLWEEIRDALAGWPVGSGYYQYTVGTDDAGEMTDALLAGPLGPLLGRLTRAEAAVQRVEALMGDWSAVPVQYLTAALSPESVQS